MKAYILATILFAALGVACTTNTGSSPNANGSNTNLPTASTANSGETNKTSTSAKETTKISFKKGEIYTDVSGSLSGTDDTQKYSAEMSGKDGEMMVVDPEGQPEARSIHIMVKAPSGKTVGVDDDSCNNRVEVPQTTPGNYTIVVMQCAAKSKWSGKFTFRLGAGPGKLF